MANPESRAFNRDPITGKPGSHPVGVGLGGVGGAAVGAFIGALGGPIGMLIGGSIGAVAGAAAGKGLAESIDPTLETEYWRTSYATRPYYDAKYDYDTDYGPAYTYGATARSRFGDRAWDDGLRNELRRDWEKAKANSRLSWEQAEDAVRDAWRRSDRTHRAYETADRYYQSGFERASYRDPSATFDDYRPAYRYGLHARSHYGDRDWDDEVENDLSRGWDRVKGESRLGWDKAKEATRDAWHTAERAIPGDFDRDGR